MASETGTAAGTVTPGTLARRGAVALVASLVVNWLVVFAANAAGVAPQLEPLSHPPVSFFTTVGVVGATLTYGVLGRVSSDPDQVFVAVAAIVLVASLIPDFTVIPDRPGGTLVAGASLGAMHVATAVICVAVLTDIRTRRR